MEATPRHLPRDCRETLLNETLFRVALDAGERKGPDRVLAGNELQLARECDGGTTRLQRAS